MPRSIGAAALLILTAFFLIGFIACAPSGTGGTGTLKVLITDKPYPVEWIASAEVTITRVDVRLADTEDEDTDGATDGEDGDTDDGDTDGEDGATDGGDADTDDGDDSDGDGPWITIFDSEWDSNTDGEPDGPKVFDLLDLQNGRTDILADMEVPAGKYTQMRLYVSDGSIAIDQDEDGETDHVFDDLKVPSGSQSGIKLHFTFEVLEGEETYLLLDVDLTRAFRAIPSGHIDDPTTIRGFQFQPSLAMRLIDLIDAGSISGTVTDASTDANPIADAVVTGYLDGEEITSTITEDDGTYVLSGLPAGAYLVEVSAGGFEDAQTDGVPVTAGDETSGVDFALTATADTTP